MDPRYSSIDEEEGAVGAYELRPRDSVSIKLKFDQVHLAVKL